MASLKASSPRMSIARGKLASDTNHASTAASLMHPGLLSLRILIALSVQDAVLCILDPIAPGMLDMAPFSLNAAPGMLETAPCARDGAIHATVR